MSLVKILLFEKWFGSNYRWDERSWLFRWKYIEFMSLVKLFFYISIVSSALPVLINIIYYKSISFNTSDFKFWFQLLSFERFLSNIGILILMFTLKNSIPIYHFSILIEFLIITKLFDLEKRLIFNYLLWFCAIVVFLTDLFFTSDLLHLNTFSAILTYSVIVGLGWKYLYDENSKNEKYISLVSIFLYYLGSIFYLLFEQHSITIEKAFDSGFIVLATLSVLFNLSNTYTTWSLQKKLHWS